MGSVAHLVHESSCNLVYIPVSQRRFCNNAPERGDFSSMDQVCGGETELGSFTGEVRFLLLLCTFLDYTYSVTYIMWPQPISVSAPFRADPGCVERSVVVLSSDPIWRSKANDKMLVIIEFVACDMPKCISTSCHFLDVRRTLLCTVKSRRTVELP